MIRKIRIENYRCFEVLTVDLRDLTILVGKNNAGKSTLIEVLRITSIVAGRCINLNFKKSPSWLDMQPMYLGVSPSIHNLEISTKNLFYHYGDAPSKITVTFSNKVRLEIYVGEGAEIFALIYNQKNELVKSKHQARQLNLRAVNILPQISPLQREESTLKRQTVLSGEDTYLASRHFRNQIRYDYGNFQNFREMAEYSWRGLAIRELGGRSTFEGGNLSLIVSDGGFAAEIGWMGHGLQMWLQTIWFLSRSSDDSTIILDEPDVYMHADLQRKLIRLIKNKYKQIIIATHSVEIMAEVEAENILPVDSKQKKLSYAHHTPMVQEIIENIGSVHNLEIARIFMNKKFLIVEGDSDDTKILGILHDILFPNSHEPIDTIPKTFVEGWGGWQRVIGSNKVFRDTKLQIMTYCFLDSDYHLEEEKENRYKEAEENSINLHIWKKKEIENYVISANIIHRTILKEDPDTKASLEDIEKIIDVEVDKLKEEVTDDFATEIQSKSKGIAVKTANKKAREIIESDWEEKKLSLVPGKKMISALSRICHKKYHVSFNQFKLARNMLKSEIDEEVTDVLKKLNANQTFK